MKNLVYLRTFLRNNFPECKIVELDTSHRAVLYDNVSGVKIKDIDYVEHLKHIITNTRHKVRKGYINYDMFLRNNLNIPNLHDYIMNILINSKPIDIFNKIEDYLIVEDDIILKLEDHYYYGIYSGHLIYKHLGKKSTKEPSVWLDMIKNQDWVSEYNGGNDLSMVESPFYTDIIDLYIRLDIEYKINKLIMDNIDTIYEMNDIMLLPRNMGRYRHSNTWKFIVTRRNLRIKNYSNSVYILLNNKTIPNPKNLNISSNVWLIYKLLEDILS